MKTPNNFQIRNLFLVLLIILFNNCAAFNRKNTPLIRAVENNLVPQTNPSKILLAPLYIPIGIAGGILDIFIIHPALQIKPSFVETRRDLWSIQFNGYFTEMGSLPVRAILSPVYFSLGFLFRSVFDVSSDIEYSSLSQDKKESIESVLDKKNTNGILSYLNSAEITIKDKETMQRILNEYPASAEGGIYSTALFRLCSETLYKDYEDFLLSLFPNNSNSSLTYCFTRQKSKKFSRILLQTITTTDLPNEKFIEYLNTLVSINDPDDIKSLKLKLKK